ncbi:hypothetical protein [Methylobacterium sp. 17Sr1-1]|uniref:hypothetical protein n=1 Tax=Methylobacterium sp. 17Sr1-1 TaxID=2202826 RepID=UPI0013A553A0|nr:hypothetical protein [Methylobacterium sp. 17Sr1-1]
MSRIGGLAGARRDQRKGSFQELAARWGSIRLIDNVNRRERLAGHFDGWDDLHGVAAFQRGEHQQDRIFVHREALARFLEDDEIEHRGVVAPSIMDDAGGSRAHHRRKLLRRAVPLLDGGPHDFERISALREIERLPRHRDTRNSVTHPSDRQT